MKKISSKLSLFLVVIGLLILGNLWITSNALAQTTPTIFYCGGSANCVPSTTPTTNPVSAISTLTPVPSSSANAPTVIPATSSAPVPTTQATTAPCHSVAVNAATPSNNPTHARRHRGGGGNGGGGASSGLIQQIMDLLKQLIALIQQLLGGQIPAANQTANPTPTTAPANTTPGAGANPTSGEPTVTLPPCPTTPTTTPATQVTVAPTAQGGTTAPTNASQPTSAQITSAPTIPAAVSTAPSTAPIIGSTGDIYVATTGSDSNPGTQASPFQTITKADSVVKAGNVVHVASGTYPGGITTTTSGTTASRITFVSDTQYGAIIKGGSLTSDGALWNIQGAHVDLRGFDFDGSSSPNAYMLVYPRAADLGIYNSKIHDMQTGGLLSWGGAITPDNYYGATTDNGGIVSGCTVYNVGRQLRDPEHRGAFKPDR